MKDKIILFDETEQIDKEFTLLATFGLDECDYCALTEDGENVMFFRMEDTDSEELILVGIEEEELEDVIRAYEELSSEHLN